MIPPTSAPNGGVNQWASWNQGRINAQLAAGLTGVPEVRLIGGGTSVTQFATAFATVDPTSGIKAPFARVGSSLRAN